MRERLKALANSAFIAGDRVGVHLLPAHYYSSVANRKKLRRTEQEWRRPLMPPPFDWDLEDQVNWTRRHAEHVDEVPLSSLENGGRRVGGYRYGPIEGQFWYSLLRTLAPARILEIGSGSSTWLASTAVQANVAQGLSATDIVACDPYTASDVVDLPHVTAKAVGGQLVSAEVDVLAPGDVLFIDSTHTVRTGSELAHLYLELLPRVRAGVLVHIHDIYLPYLFAPDVYTSMFDWQETTLVAALLAGNGGLNILACQSALAWERKDDLAKIFPEYRPRRMNRGLTVAADDGHFPSSLWLEVR